MFLWCIVTELCLSSKSWKDDDVPLASKYWKDDDLSLYAIVYVLSCVRFISLLRFRLWNIQTKGQFKGQYPN